jgi:hypothetical protein
MGELLNLHHGGTMVMVLMEAEEQPRATQAVLPLPIFAAPYLFRVFFCLHLPPCDFTIS